jgi:hypothetical protein
MADNSRRIYQQIETDAKTWGPWVYNKLLSFYSTGLEVNADPLDTNYIPLTTASLPRGSSTLPFIIGLIPPSVKITGRRLDRSASVASVEGVKEAALIPLTPGDVPASTVKNGEKYASIQQPEFYSALVGMCARLDVDPKEMIKVMISESGLDPHIVHPKSSAKGLVQMMPIVKKGLGMPEDVWNNFENLSGAEQMPWIEKMFKANRLAPKSNRGMIYKKTFLPNAVIGPNGELTQRGHPYYDDNSLLDIDHDGFITIQDLSARTNYKLTTKIIDGIEQAKNPQAAPAFPPDAATSSWATNGSKDANTAKKAEAETAGKSIPRSKLFDRLTTAQSAQMFAMEMALELMASTPPLRMLVNPTSFKVAGAKIISDGNWARNGPIIEHWGNDQDKIDVSGKIAGFFAVDAAAPHVSGPGLTRMARNFSKSYQNFLSLYLLYKNNGGIYLPDGDPTGTKPTNLVVVGSVYIYYDSTLYIGSFESFSITETDTAPFTLEYSYTFNVRAAFLLDQPPDPRHTYGVKKNTIPTASSVLNTGAESSNTTLDDLKREFASESGITTAVIKSDFIQASGLDQLNKNDQAAFDKAHPKTTLKTTTPKDKK